MKTTILPHLFTTWSNMMRRCYFTNDQSFHHYGGRGIYVCRRWHSLFKFCRDMGPRPSPQHSLERLNNDKSYGPDNCKWATVAEQLRNRRITRWITYKGERLTVNEWAARTGISHITIRSRLRKKWTPEQIIETPPERPRGYLRVKQRAAKVLCEQAGIPLSTFYYRLTNGWTDDEALHTPKHQRTPIKKITQKTEP